VQRRRAVTATNTAGARSTHSLDTFSSNQNDRRGAESLSKIAQIGENRMASGRGWTKGRLTRLDQQGSVNKVRSTRLDQQGLINKA
jgi:hypothetical protein